ncbi:MAG: TRAP transporter small permease [Desulfatiglans sp.]|nr:TRAP transporter small permease [Desulfatiglans sp.]
MQVISLVNKFNNFLVLILKHIAIWILAAMMFITAIDVFLRYIFNSPISGSFELVEYMMALVVPFSIVFCAKHKAHVRVDIILDHAGKKVRSFIHFLGSILSLCLFSIIAWQACIYVTEEYVSRLTSSVLYIPVYPFIGALAAAFIILSLLTLAEAINYFAGNIKWSR